MCPISLQHDDKAHAVTEILGHRMDAQTFGETLRVCLDAAINSAATNRYCVEELEKSEKTAIGTRVEIALRDMLGFPKGQVLDLLVGTIEVDIKWSTGSTAGPGTSWMIPTESFGHLALLVTAWDSPVGSFFSAGLLRVADEGNNLGKPNKDKKRGVPKGVRENDVWWLYESQPMPTNFLLGLTDTQRKLVLSKPAGAERITEALRHTPHPIAESQIRLLDVPEPRHRIPHIDQLLQGSVVHVDESGNWSVSHVTGR